MIQSLRENLSGAVAGILVALIAIPLAFFGVESIFLNSTRVNDVATVNGEKITELELERAVVSQINQIMSYLGADVDPSIIDQAAIRPVALEQLIEQKALLSKAKSANLAVSDQFLGDQVRSMPSFQIGGQFNQTVFSNFLVNYGYTPSSFAEALADEIVANQILAGIRATAFASQKDLQQRIELTDETRSYQYFTIPEADVMASVEIPEEDVQAYFEFYQEDYRLPDMVALNYVSLSDDLFLEETAEREDLADLVLERFELLKGQQGDQRRVSHILFEETDEATVEEQVAAVQERLSAGEAFAELASEFSVDVGSANFGGDLGFTQGATFPDSFEAAIANLSAGDVSEAVETDAGTHLILVSEVTETNFEIETQYASIELEIRTELAQDIYLDALEELRELAFSTDDLDQLKDSFTYGESLIIETSESFTEDSGAGIASNAAVRAVAFSDIVLESQLNSEVIELAENEAVVVHLAEFTPSYIPPIEEVRDQIIAQLQREEAGALLSEIAAELEAEIRNGATLDSVADREGYAWQAALDTPRAAAGDVGNMIFSALVDVGLPIVSGGRTSEGNYHVYKITQATAGQMENQTAEQLVQAREQVALERSEIEWVAYTESLKENSNIDRKVDYSVTDTEL
jgi:peptidyl-prolyl cis-trans isomerase D